MDRKHGSWLLSGIALLLMAVPSGLAAIGSGTGNAVDHDVDVFGGHAGAFIENKGQYDPSIAFVAEMPYGHIALTAGGVLIDLRTIDRSDGSIEGYVVGIAFEGASSVQPVGEDRTPTEYNYYNGKDPEGWAIGARGYRTAIYRDLWDGIDLVYRFTENGLKYDLIVRPGAEVSDIRFSTGDLPVTGGSRSVSIGTPLGDLTDSGLIAFDAEGKEVGIAFDIDDGSYGFDVGSYDGSGTLTIDPNMNVVEFSTYVGGSAEDYSYDMDRDTSGNIYVCGETYSSNFPVTKGAYQTVNKNWTSDGFVFKMDPTGKTILIATYIGGENWDGAKSIKVNSRQEVFITGTTASPDFPTTKGAFSETMMNYSSEKGSEDFFVTKFDSRMGSLLFSTYVGGSEYEQMFWSYAHCLDIDSKGNVYVTGMTSSSDFPVTSDAFQNSIGGKQEFWTPYDIVVFKLSSDGSTLDYGSYLGGTSDEYATSLEYRDTGLLYIGGFSYSTDFNTTKDAIYPSVNGYMDAILSVFDLSTGALYYSTYFGGMDWEEIHDIEVDGNGTLYACGGTYSSDFPVTRDAYNTASNGENDGFAFALDISTNTLAFSTYIGGSMSEDGMNAIYIDQNGIVHMAGTTQSEDFPVKDGSFIDEMPDQDMGGWRSPSAVYVKLSADGSELIYATYIGGTSDDFGENLVVDEASGRPIVVGDTYSSDFPVTEDAYQNYLNGWLDVYLIKIDLTLPPWAPMNPAIVFGDEFLYLTWEEPLFDGGAPIENYTVYKGLESGEYLWGFDVGLNLFYNDTNVTNGRIYYYVIVAANSAGPGPYSDEVMSMPASVPSSPENFTVVYGSEHVNISWDPPNDAGGLQVLGYILFKAVSGNAFVPIEIDVGFWSFTDLEVENGITYEYYMVALNILGMSAPTPVLNATPRYRPLSPIELTPVSGTEFVILTWSAPEFDGGAQILGYYLYKSHSGQLFGRIAKLSPDTLTYNDTDVIKGRIYEYYVTAFNSEGESDMSEKATAKPVSRPSPPLDVEAAAGEGSVTVRWDPPSDDGGLLINYYTVWRVSGFLVERVKTATNGEEEYVDLTVINGKTYSYYVTATNTQGDSDPSAYANATPRGKPSQPLDLTIKAGNGYALLSWGEPSSNGGSPIASYWIYRGTSVQNLQVLTNVTSLEFNDTSVKNGITYWYSVKAMNDMGFSPQSTSAFANPMGLPGLPEDVAITTGDRWVEIAWSLPVDDGGSDIVQVTIFRVAPGGAPVPINPPNLEGTYRDSNLQNGMTYGYYLSASNSLGSGPVTRVYNATPSGRPDAPGALKVVIEKGSPKLTWEAPASDGGSPLTGYRIYRAGTGTEVNIAIVPATATSFLDASAEPGKYTYTVSAENANGESAHSGIGSISVKEAKESSLPLVLIALLVLLLIAALVTIAVLMKKVNKAKVAQEQYPTYLGMPPQAEQMMMPPASPEQQLPPPQVQAVQGYTQGSLPPAQMEVQPPQPEAPVSYPVQTEQPMPPQPPQ